MALAVVNTFIHVQEEGASDEIAQRRKSRRAQTTGVFTKRPSVDEDTSENSCEVFGFLSESTMYQDSSQQEVDSVDSAEGAESPRYALPPKMKTRDAFDSPCAISGPSAGTFFKEDGTESPLYVVPPKMSDFPDNARIITQSSPKSTTGQESADDAETPKGLPPKMKTCDGFDDSPSDILGPASFFQHSAEAPSSVMPLKLNRRDPSHSPELHAGPLSAGSIPAISALRMMMAQPAASASLGAGFPEGWRSWPQAFSADAGALALQAIERQDAGAAEDGSGARLGAPLRLQGAVAPPQPEQARAPNKVVTCSYLSGGTASICWRVDSRRFSGHDTTLVSPAFSVDLPSYGPQDFKIVVHSTSSGPGGAGFRNAKGRGRMELKCEVQLPGECEIAFEKPEGALLGVDLASQDSEPWCIQSIGCGLIQQWNEENHGVKVTAGDRIVQVNGIQGNPNDVKAACCGTGTMRMRLQRSKEDAPAFQVSFGVGGSAAGAEASAASAMPAMRGPVLHRFTEQSCCGLRHTVFNFVNAVDKAAKKVAIHVEVAPAAAA